MSILDFYIFNQALLGKWWWKFLIDDSWCLSKVISFNYSMSRGIYFPDSRAASPTSGVGLLAVFHPFMRASLTRCDPDVKHSFGKIPG